MTDDEKLTELEALFRNAALGLGSEDPYSYMARGVSAGHCLEAADAIHTLRQRNARLVEGLSNIATRLEALENYGDPYEIADDPEDFGGTDDGLETVCMAYENLQGSAAAIGRTARTLIEDNSNG